MDDGVTPHANEIAELRSQNAKLRAKLKSARESAKINVEMRSKRVLKVLRQKDDAVIAMRNELKASRASLSKSRAGALACIIVL